MSCIVFNYVCIYNYQWSMCFVVSNFHDEVFSGNPSRLANKNHVGRWNILTIPNNIVKMNQEPWYLNPSTYEATILYNIFGSVCRVIVITLNWHSSTLESQEFWENLQEYWTFNYEFLQSKGSLFPSSKLGLFKRWNSTTFHSRPHKTSGC